MDEFRLDENARWHTRTADKILTKFKVHDHGRAEVQQLLTNPVIWARGQALPEDHLAPWEKLLFGLSGFFEIASGGFNQRDRLWRFTFNVNPMHITYSGIVLTVFDAVSDFLIGQWMDRHPLRDTTYRRIVRTVHIIATFLNFFWLWDFGFTSAQRVILFTIVQAMMDVVGTTSRISRQKYFVGITPLSTERAKTWVWNETGKQFGWPIGNIPGWIFGFARDREHWSDHRVFTRGFMLTMPLALAQGVIDTYARNRVEAFVPDLKAPEEQQDKESEKKLTLRESVYVLRHNRFLLLNTAAGFLGTFVPRGDEYPIYRGLVPPVRVFGRELRGEAIIPVRNQISGTPMTFILPVMGAIVNKCGGARRYQIGANAIIVMGNIVKYFTGFEGPAAVATIMIIDILNQNLGMLYGFSNRILEFEFLDYVEYKTGVRSEGLNTSFSALFSTVIKRNIGDFTHNFFQSWSGIYRHDWDSGEDVPERFRRWAWTFFTLGLAFEALLQGISRIIMKYDPKDRLYIEAELNERRALKEQAKQEVEETSTVL